MLLHSIDVGCKQMAGPFVRKSCPYLLVRVQGLATALKALSQGHVRSWDMQE